MISSLDFSFNAAIANCKAVVPLLVVRQYLFLTKKPNFFSNIFTYFPTEDIQPDFTASVTYLSSFPERDGSDCGN